MVDISIIFVTRNAEEYFEESLEGVYSNANRLGCSFDVLIVDSGSTDSTIDIAKRYPARLYTISESDFHHGKTRNYGASLASGKILVFLTADAIPFDERWLANLIAPLKACDVAAAYGRQIPHNTHIFERYFVTYMYPENGAVRYIRDRNAPVRLRDIFFSDVNSAIKREVWERHKFDENIVLSEDQEWAMRVLMDGYKIVYEPKAAVYHSHEYRLKRLFRRNFDSGASLSNLTNERLMPAIAELAGYLLGEIRYILRQGEYLQLLRFFPYEFCRLAGFILGLNEHLIQDFIKSYFSTQPHHWRPTKTKEIQE